MLNVASLSSAPPQTAAPLPNGASRKDARAFSYDDAAAALERQASRAIDAHGGAPSQAVTAADSAAASERVPPTRAAETSKRATETRAGKAPIAPDANLLAADTARQVTSGIAPVSTSLAIAPATPFAPGAIAPATNSSIAAVRDTAARLKVEAPRAAIIGRQPAPTVAQFAQILAQRLDSASQFDLRLDPPSLGQIDGRLTLGDNGSAVLSLAFDNQSAFDLFSRDEQALRQALADAGFSVGGGDLQFRFSEPEPTDADDTALTAATRSQPPAFLTPFAPHSGAIDIRA